jgi:hypothetical protein
MATKEIDRNPVNDRFLNCIGFFEKPVESYELKSPEYGKLWVWGSFTKIDSFGRRDIPILIWNEQTKMMKCVPIDYEKQITTIEGFRKVIESVNFLMSTEQ